MPMNDKAKKGSCRKRWLIGVSALALLASGATIYAWPLAEDPDGPKDCGAFLDSSPATGALKNETAVEPTWSQKGGTINDISCLNRTPVAGIVSVKSDNDVSRALSYARRAGLTVTAAGAKHSMGGQAFRAGGVVLDMRGMNQIALDAAEQSVTVGAGATWHDIQNAIHPRFAVKAMQSTDIFTVGGSIAVNAHGMDHQAGAVMGSLRAMRVMLADGSVVTASREENAELFRNIVGGYGLFGIILSATLDVVPNDVYRSERSVIDYTQFPDHFAEIEADPNIGLTYTHLSTAPGNLLKEALVYRYRKNPSDQGLERAPLSEVASTKLRRLTVNLSKRSNFFKSAKWWAEKNIEHRIETCTITRAQAMKDGEACLVSRNDPMHDSVAYLRDNLKQETDILHEYFVPRDQIIPFIDGMRKIFEEQDVNLLNASIRAVDAEDNVLSYAPEKAYSLVLYINQSATSEGNAKMAKLTQDLIDLTHAHKGRFFLPYQLHYSTDQLLASYPMMPDFIKAKKQWDPAGLFSNSWYARYAPEVEERGKQPPATRASSTSTAPA